MPFLKTFFTEEVAFVGLSQFNLQDSLKTMETQETFNYKEVFFNPFQTQQESILSYQTNVADNLLLL